jgi:hypothetical protein
VNNGLDSNPFTAALAVIDQQAYALAYQTAVTSFGLLRKTFSLHADHPANLISHYTNTIVHEGVDISLVKDDVVTMIQQAYAEYFTMATYLTDIEDGDFVTPELKVFCSKSWSDGLVHLPKIASITFLAIYPNFGTPGTSHCAVLHYNVNGSVFSYSYYSEDSVDQTTVSIPHSSPLGTYPLKSPMLFVNALFSKLSSKLSRVSGHRCMQLLDSVCQLISVKNPIPIRDAFPNWSFEDVVSILPDLSQAHSLNGLASTPVLDFPVSLLTDAHETASLLHNESSSNIQSMLHTSDIKSALSDAARGSTLYGTIEPAFKEIVQHGSTAFL